MIFMWCTGVNTSFPIMPEHPYTSSEEEISHTFVDFVAHLLFPFKTDVKQVFVLALDTMAVPQHERTHVPLNEILFFSVFMLSLKVASSASNDFLKSPVIVSHRFRF